MKIEFNLPEGRQIPWGIISASLVSTVIFFHTFTALALLPFAVYAFVRAVQDSEF